MWEIFQSSQEIYENDLNLVFLFLTWNMYLFAWNTYCLFLRLITYFLFIANYAISRIVWNYLSEFLGLQQ